MSYIAMLSTEWVKNVWALCSTLATMSEIRVNIILYLAKTEQGENITIVCTLTQDSREKN